jgi:hypothetical protein
VATLSPAEIGPQHFLAAYDLDRDGLPEIIFGNQVFRYVAEQGFLSRPLSEHRQQPLTGALLADFTGDGNADLLCADPGQRPELYVADARGAFAQPPQVVESVDPVNVSMAMTAGDVNRDGHLDVWLTQYLNPYHQGRIPDPYYDANDGPPSYLLLGDGQGGFHDATGQAGLADKRFRRTYSSSLVDLDGDHDLDLLVVSDFAGVDIYRNDGRGTFQDVTRQWLDQWHNFGMSHSLADFDGDGRLDFYVTGMASTTARRLESLGVGRSDLPEHTRMRAIMGYGNRMYLARGSHFEQPDYRQQVARTGWSWGSTAPDFDNDGDRDLYVGNGHISGPSARDYCSIFWRHDIYAGSSAPDPAMATFFQQLHRQFQQSGSWNGFEHNSLLMNQSGRGFFEVGFLMGVASEFDTRNVVAADVDGDGRVDLLVAEHPREAPARLHVYQNHGVYPGHWLGLVLADSPGRTAMGATVTVRTPQDRYVHHFVSGDSFNSQHPLTAHFGLGSSDQVDRVEIRWPDGSIRHIESPAIDQYHRLERAANR